MNGSWGMLCRELLRSYATRYDDHLADLLNLGQRRSDLRLDLCACIQL